MEINYNSAAEIRAFLEKEGLGMRKKFGQNFLLNADIRARLTDALEAEAGASVWEIGPGLGAMTKLLLDKGLAVWAFEIDPGFSRILRCFFAECPGFTLIEGDVMKTWPQQPASPLLLGNLPYNIAAVLMGDMIEKGRLFRRMVVTVQYEVAQRMIAKPGSADYSSFSILCASAYSIKKLTAIKGGAFYPRPNVDSMGLMLDIRPGHENYPRVLYPLVRRLFLSRRKMIKNNLSNFLISGMKNQQKPADILAADILSENGLSGNERAENLDIEAFVKLAKTIEAMRILE